MLRNLQRVTKLFVTKSAFAAFLILTIGLTEQDYPVLPRHLTLVATLTIGIPALPRARAQLGPLADVAVPPRGGAASRSRPGRPQASASRPATCSRWRC